MLVIAVATVGGLVFILIVLVVIAICVLLFRGRKIKRTGEWCLCYVENTIFQVALGLLHVAFFMSVLTVKYHLSSSPWSATCSLLHVCVDSEIRDICPGLTYLTQNGGNMLLMLAFLRHIMCTEACYVCK